MAFLMQKKILGFVFVFFFLAALRVEALPYSKLKSTGLVVSANSASSPSTALMVVSSNMAGIGATNPSGKLAISTTGADLSGTAFSSTFRINGGSLGTTAGSEFSIASFGFLSGNESVLGIRAIRPTAGTDWTTSAIGVGLDVDNTIRSGASLFFHGNGNLGIGTSTPAYKLQVSGTIDNSLWAATEVMSNVNPAVNGTYGLTLQGTTSFTTSGGTLRIFTSGSAYSSVSFDLQVTFYITDTSGNTLYTLGHLTVYCNELSKHRPFVPRTFVRTDIPAGTYKIKIIAASTTVIDTNDYFNCTVLEFPF